MKFNWGHGILVTIILCSSGIILLVYLSSREKIDLVTEEYYPKELVYEQEINKIKNTNSLAEKLSFIEKQDSLFIVFPRIVALPDSITGKILFYFPADKTGDKSIDIQLTDNYFQAISLLPFRSGKYEVIVNWMAEKREYYQKENIFIQKY